MPCFSFTGGSRYFLTRFALGRSGTVLKVIPSRLQKLTGKRHIDYVVISHYHQDHFRNPEGGPKTRRSGLYSLLDDANIAVGTLIDRGRWALGKPSATYRKYHQATQRWLSERKVRGIAPSRPEIISSSTEISGLRLLLRRGMDYSRNFTSVMRISLRNSPLARMTFLLQQLSSLVISSSSSVAI